MSFEELVERYYERVRRHLEELGVWEETVRRFPPEAIRSAIREILERLDQHGEDPEILDWGALFERLRDYPSIDAFIRALEEERYIPPNLEREASRVASELEAELMSLLDQLAKLSPEALREVESRIRSILGEEDELEKLREKVRRLETTVKRERKLRKEYAEALKQYQEKVKQLERRAEELRKLAEVEARRAPPPPTPPPPMELRARVEYHIKSQIPRVYRIDWLRDRPLTARITCHRDVYESLLKKIRELGGRVIREISVRPPMKEVEADFSEAKPPPVPVSPEVERYLLWSKFSAAITSAGGDPEKYREDFEAVLKATEGLPLEERQRAVERLARDIVRELAPPPPPAPPVSAEEIRRIVREELERARAPPAPPPVAAPAVAAPEPRIVTRVDPETGELYPAPDDTSMAILMNILPFPREWFYSSPRRQREYFRWPTLLEAIEAAVERPEVHLPAWIYTIYPWILDWLKRLRDRLREAYMEAGMPA